MMQRSRKAAEKQNGGACRRRAALAALLPGVRRSCCRPGAGAPQWTWGLGVSPSLGKLPSSPRAWGTHAGDSCSELRRKKGRSVVSIDVSCVAAADTAFSSHFCADVLQGLGFEVKGSSGPCSAEKPMDGATKVCMLALGLSDTAWQTAPARLECVRLACRRPVHALCSVGRSSAEGLPGACLARLQRPGAGADQLVGVLLAQRARVALGRLAGQACAGCDGHGRRGLACRAGCLQPRWASWGRTAPSEAPCVASGSHATLPRPTTKCGMRVASGRAAVSAQPAQPLS